MKICVSADSTCDIPSEIIKNKNIQLMPLCINLGDEERFENEVSPDEIYAFVDKTGILPKTSARSIFEYEEHFKKLKKSYDYIIHFSLSNKISATGENARKASEKFEGVKVIDSQSLSSGSGLLALSAADKIEQGKTFEKIIEEINKEIPKVQASFIINKLDYLHKGGRCSGLAVFGANVLRLKIKIELSDGKMIVAKKYMGKLNEVLIKYVNEALKEKPPKLERIFITSSSEMKEDKEKINKILKAMGFKEIIHCLAGSTICSHCGPETLGILYFLG